MKAIINGQIILKDGIVKDHALLYTDKIEGIVPLKDLPQNAEVLDANGGFVAPGLIDLHIHGYHGKDVCDGEEESIRVISKALLENGVTAYLPTTMTVAEETIRRALEICRRLKDVSKDWDGSIVLGCHAEGPFINESRKGAQEARHIQKPNAAFVKEYADVIKLITLAPEEDQNDFAAIRDICHHTDTVVSMGHTDADYQTAMASVKAGVRHVTHLFNAMPPLSHRTPGAVNAALNADVSCEIIVDMFHVDVCLYDMLWKLKGDKLCFVTDCLPAGGLPEGEYTLGGQKIIYKGLACYLEDGSVAGSVLHLNRGVWNVYTHSSIPLWECVNCASLHPAAVLGIDRHKGSLEIGKDADIILTDADFEVQATIIGGKVKYRV